MPTSRTGGPRLGPQQLRHVLDGSVQGPDGRSGSINTESDHHVSALQRALADAILVGANTNRLEGYRAVDREPWQLEIRKQEGLAPYPMLVIISATADLDPVIATSAGSVGGAVMIITTPGKPADDLEPLRAAGVTVLGLKARRLTWPKLWISSQGLASSVCCARGGPRLHNELHAAGVMDGVLDTCSRRGGRPRFAIHQRCSSPRAELIPAASRLVRRRWGAVHRLPNCQEPRLCDPTQF